MIGGDRREEVVAEGRRGDREGGREERELTKEEAGGV